MLIVICSDKDASVDDLGNNNSNNERPKQTKIVRKKQTGLPSMELISNWNTQSPKRKSPASTKRAAFRGSIFFFECGHNSGGEPPLKCLTVFSHVWALPSVRSLLSIHALLYLLWPRSRRAPNCGRPNLMDSPKGKELLEIQSHGFLNW